ncbi:MAG: PDZ domain-containing protein [Thermaerobacter sp.]|nr:PDZ domain-containing protein [Thermaerobacter sp.]
MKLRRLLRWWWVLPVLLVVGSVAAWFVPTGYYLMLPGNTENLNRIVSVSGGKSAHRGKLLMVTVSMQRANGLLFLLARLNPVAELVPRQEMMPPGQDFQEYLRQSAEMMKESKAAAEVAALRQLGYKNAGIVGHGVQVIQVLKGMPATGKLQKGDVITAVDGHAVTLDTQLVAYMSHVRVGQTMRFTVDRHGQTRQVDVRTVRNPQGGNRPVVGILINTYELHFQIPVPIKIRTGDISGPSAGMMFSLEIIDQLDHRSLTGGRTIAGTGTIDPFGNVGPIGGIGQKVVTAYRSGARVFLCPQGNLPHALAMVHRLHLPVRVVPVRNLGQAVNFLNRGAQTA